MAGVVKLKPSLRRILVGALAIAAVAYLTVCMSSFAYAQAGEPWTLGRVDQDFAWSPRVIVVPAIDVCAVKARAESPEQACLLRAMQAGGATSKAIAFTRWYYTFSEGDSVFIDRLLKSRFGVVSIAQIELPGRANTNLIYIFVNGMPAVINAEDGFTTKLPWMKNAAFLAIKGAHRNAAVFPNEDFVGESARPNGGQRFMFAAPIVNGCHACARVGIVYVGFDFGPLGAAKGTAITAVHRCPSSDTRCRRL
jgi:hypothetical protein